MKTLSRFLAVVLFVTTLVPNTSFAASANESRIADIFNDFRYQMTVEWDQKDPAFKNAAQADLKASLMALKAEGVTDEEILAQVEKSILDEGARKDFRAALNVLKTQSLTEAQSMAFATTFMEKRYAQGASFAGSATNTKKLAIVVGIVLLAVATYFVIDHFTKKKKNDEPAPTDEEEEQPEEEQPEEEQPEEEQPEEEQPEEEIPQEEYPEEEYNCEEYNTCQEYPYNETA